MKSYEEAVYGELKMDTKLDLVEELKKKTLEQVVKKFGTGLGELSNMKLSIWDVRNILYEEAQRIAKRELTNNFKEELNKWEFNR